MRKLGFAALMLASGLSLASGPAANMPVAPTAGFTPGPYVGLTLGYADVGFDTISQASNSYFSPEGKGFAGRLNLGYAFTENWSAEIGYMYLPQLKFYDSLSNQTEYYVVKIRPIVFDIFAKGSIPIMNNFGVFGKLGAGWVHYPSVKYKGSHPPISSVNEIVPAVGFGAYYNFNDKFSMDLNWNHYLKSDHYETNPISFYGIGATYKFDL